MKRNKYHLKTREGAQMMAYEYEKATKVTITMATISKHFKKLGVERDLSAKVHTKVAAIVSAAMVSGKVSTKTLEREADIINGNALAEANVILSHRQSPNRLRTLTNRLMEEMEMMTFTLARDRTPPKRGKVVTVTTPREQVFVHRIKKGPFPNKDLNEMDENENTKSIDDLSDDPWEYFANGVFLKSSLESLEDRERRLESGRRLEAQRLKERLSSIPFYKRRVAEEGEAYWQRLASSYQGD